MNGRPTKTLLMLAGVWTLNALGSAFSKNRFACHAVRSELWQLLLAVILVIFAPNLSQRVEAQEGEVPNVQKPDDWCNLLEWTAGVNWTPWGMNWGENLDGPVTEHSLAFRSVRGGRFPLAALIEGDYELEVEFTRKTGVDSAAIFFPVGLHTVLLELDGRNNTGVFWIDGKGGFGGSPTFRPDYRIENGKKMRVCIAVRQDREKASFEIDLGPAVDRIKWNGRLSSLVNRDRGEWTITTVNRPWVGSWDNTITFHVIRARTSSGSIRRDRPDPAVRLKDLEDGLVKLTAERATSVKVGWADFTVNQIPFQAGTTETARLWPLISREFAACKDFYSAHPPSRLKCKIPKGAKAFTVTGFNASSRATNFKVVVDGQQVYESGETGIAHVGVNLPSSATLLELVVDEVGDVAYDHSYWCIPRFHNVIFAKLGEKQIYDGTSTGPKFSIASSTALHPVTHNLAMPDTFSVPVSPRDARPCDEFLFCHAPSTVTYAVPEGMTRFTAIAYNERSQHVKYEVWADTKRLLETPQCGIIPIDVKLPSGTKTVELKVSDMEGFVNDFSFWCYPRLHRK